MKQWQILSLILIVLAGWALLPGLPLLNREGAAEADAGTFAPGDSVALVATLSGSDGFMLTGDIPDSVVAEIYMIDPATGLPDYWKRVYLAEADTAIWVGFTRADSTNDDGVSLGGHYYATITAWTVEGGRPHDSVGWKISDAMTTRGPRQVKILATKDAGTIVAGATVAVRDQVGASVLDTGTTGSDGYWTWWRPEVAGIDTFLVYITLAGVSWTTPESLFVNGADVDTTYDGTSFDPGSPTYAGMEKIFDWYKYPAGAGRMEPRGGVTVRCRLQKGTAPYVSAWSLALHTYTTVTDTAGYWRIDVVPNADITPAGTQYLFEIMDSPPQQKRVTVALSGDAKTQWNEL